MEVEVPEHNTVVEFPDTMPPGQIQAELLKVFPAKREFKAEYPKTYAAGMTLATIPENVAALGEKVVSGATLGISEKVKQAGEYLSERVMGKLLGTEKVATPSTTELLTGEKTEPLPALASTGAEMTGAFAPISAVGGGVARAVRAVTKAAPTSKIAAPLTNIAGWSAAGAGYGAAEKVIKEGEAPTAESLSTDAALWGGMETIVSSLGWGGRLALGVNRLAKLLEVAGKEGKIPAEEVPKSWYDARDKATKIILSMAKADDLPIAYFARDYSKLQEGLKKMGQTEAAQIKMELSSAAQDFVDRVNVLATKEKKLGTAEDLNKQVQREAANANAAKGIKTLEEDAKLAQQNEGYAGSEGVPVAVEPKPILPGAPAEDILVKDVLNKEIKRILDTPSFQWTAEDRIAMRKFMQEGKGTNLPESDPLKAVGKMQQEEVIIPGEAGYMGPRQEKSKIDPLTESGVEPPVERRSMTEQNSFVRNYFEQQSAKLLQQGKKVDSVKLFNEGLAKWEKISAKNLRPALKIDGNVYVAETPTGSNHGIVWNSVPEGTMLKAKKVVSGWAKADGTGFTKTPKQMMGVVSGVQQDENGNYTVDLPSAAAGLGAAMLFGRAFKKVKKTYPNTPAGKVDEVFDKTRQEIMQSQRFTFEKFKDAFLKGFVDYSWKAKKMVKDVDASLGGDIERRFNAISGAPAEAKRQIDDAKELIYGPLKQSEEEIVDKIISAERSLAIAKYKTGFEFSEGLTPADYASFMKDLQKNYNLSPAQVAKYKDAASKYFEEMQNQLKQEFDAGIHRPEGFAEMSKHLYSPRKVLDYLDSLDKKVTGRPVNAGDAGIKKLKGGSEKLIEIRSQLLLEQRILRAQDLIARVKANNELLKMADSGLQNNFIRRAKVVRKSSLGVPEFEKPGIGEDVISTLVNGEKVEMLAPKEFVDSWSKGVPLINLNFAQALQWGFGGKILKPIAIGLNPWFAVKNVPRDLLTIWSGNQYSPHLPVAAAQVAKDIAAVAGDVFKNKGRAVDYVKEGGGMEYLTYYGKTGTKIRGLKEAEEILSYVGAKSEQLGRVMHRERALKNAREEFIKINQRAPRPDEVKALQFKATQTAREKGIDFAQGGAIIKALDNIFPLLSPSVQGIRTIVKNARENPLIFAYKVAQLGALGITLNQWNRSNLDAWKSISDKDKVANWIVVLPDILPGVTSYTDDKGRKVYRYLKFAKEQTLRPIISAFEALDEWKETGKPPSKQLMLAAKDAMVPYSAPTASAFLAAFGGFDDYKWEQIWKGSPNIPKGDQSYMETPEVFKDIGQATGVSPEGLRTGVAKLLPTSNPFVGGVGLGIQMATEDIGEKYGKKSFNQLMSENPAMRTVIGTTIPSVQYRERLHDENEVVAGENFRRNRGLDELTVKFLHSGDQADGQAIANYIAAQPEDKQESLIKRYNEAYELKDLPDRDYWIAVKRSPIEVRAKELFTQYMELPSEQREQFLATANEVNGVVTEAVVERWNELMKEYKGESK